MLTPKDYVLYNKYAEHFGGWFGCTEPDGRFVYTVNNKIYNLSAENEAVLLEVMNRAWREDRNLFTIVYEEFDPYSKKENVY